MARKQEKDALERGDIFFFYRPRVNPPSQRWEPRSLEDIATSYIVVLVRRRKLYRLIVLGRKRLPDLRRGREWGFVEKVADRSGEIEDDLKRGERATTAARPAGEGVYALVRHQDHTHFAYALDLPGQPGTVQRELRIEREASYIVAVRNPDVPSAPDAGRAPDEAARYPKPLQERFEGRRFMPADPPELLNYPGAQLLLMGAAVDVRDELGIDLKPGKETERTAEIFRDLRLARSGSRFEPLLTGRWK